MIVMIKENNMNIGKSIIKGLEEAVNISSRGIRKVATESKKTIICKNCGNEVKMVMIDNGFCFKCDNEDEDDK